jgi:hypothetical protein
MSYEISEHDLELIREYSNFEEPTHEKLWHRFNRFRLRHPDEELTNMIPYVVFTKPECNFYKEYSNGSSYNEEITSLYQFNDLLKHHPRVFQNLQANQGNGDYITTFSNSFESIDISDRVIKTRDSVETSNDWKVVYGHKMNDSLGAGTFNVTFRDNRFKTVYHTLEGWVNYIDLITKGFITPTRRHRDDKILDYAASAYYFMLAEDFQTILYYCKFIGVFPLNIPDSAFTSSSKALDYNIQFQYSYKDPTPAVIADFNNINSYKDTNIYMPIYKDGNVQSTWASSVYIEDTTDGYKLRFIK